MIALSGVGLASRGTPLGLVSSIPTSLSPGCVAICNGMPLHLGSSLQPIDTALFAILVLGGLASALLVSLGVYAFVRRQSRSYLLVILALGTLVLKALLGGLALWNVIPISQHHLIEHTLDVLMAAFLLTAVYEARTPPKPTRNTREQHETSSTSETSAQNGGVNHPR